MRNNELMRVKPVKKKERKRFGKQNSRAHISSTFALVFLFGWFELLQLESCFLLVAISRALGPPVSFLGVLFAFARPNSVPLVSFACVFWAPLRVFVNQPTKQIVERVLLQHYQVDLNAA